MKTIYNQAARKAPVQPGDHVMLVDLENSCGHEIYGDETRVGIFVEKQTEIINPGCPIPGMDKCTWWVVDFGGAEPEKIAPNDVATWWTPKHFGQEPWRGSGHGNSPARLQADEMRAWEELSSAYDARGKENT